MNKEIDAEGGCMCGNVRYHVKGEVLGAEYCHCGQCQTQSGAHAMAFADFNNADVTWMGKAIKNYHSSEFGRRGFCPDCGSNLTWRSTRHPEAVTLTITSLDDPNLVAPQKHIYTADKLVWFDIADGLKQE